MEVPAVTIYIEKMPKYIFDSQILICDEKYYREFKEKNADNPLKQNTDAVIFYDVFMDSASTDDRSDIIALQTAMKEKFITRNRDYRYDDSLKKYMGTLWNIKKQSAGDFRGYMSRIRSSSDETEKLIANYCIEKNFSSFGAMINTLCNQNEQVLSDILGKKTEKLDTLDKKIRTAENITMMNCYHEGVTINEKTDINVLQSILFDYIYVKSVRNHINHASDEENLNEQQKKKLEERDYNVGEFTTRVISDIIKNSVERIESAASAVLKG